jgi:hypothetical protein
MVAEGEETAASRLCSSASTSASLESLLDGKLTDLRWKAIVCNGIGVPAVWRLEMLGKIGESVV